MQHHDGVSLGLKVSPQHTAFIGFEGWVVALFRTRAGDPRAVVESASGELLICRMDQLGRIERDPEGFGSG